MTDLILDASAAVVASQADDSLENLIDEVRGHGGRLWLYAGEFTDILRLLSPIPVSSDIRRDGRVEAANKQFNLFARGCCWLLCGPSCSLRATCCSSSKVRPATSVRWRLSRWPSRASEVRPGRGRWMTCRSSRRRCSSWASQAPATACATRDTGRMFGVQGPRAPRHTRELVTKGS